MMNAIVFVLVSFCSKMRIFVFLHKSIFSLLMLYCGQAKSHFDCFSSLVLIKLGSQVLWRKEWVEAGIDPMTSGWRSQHADRCNTTTAPSPTMTSPCNQNVLGKRSDWSIGTTVTPGSIRLHQMNSPSVDGRTRPILVSLIFLAHQNATGCIQDLQDDGPALANESENYLWKFSFLLLVIWTESI